MVSPPPLLLVLHALPLRIQTVFHIPQLISEYLMPATIDAAVYHELQRVLQVFESFRPYTVGAMDGAAARGLLHVAMRLHETRDEGCSTAAFIDAAANGHLDVLRWLYSTYPRLCRSAEEMKVAAENGQAEIVHFLIRDRRVQYEDRVNTFVAAAANGQAAVTEVFLADLGFSHDALVAAAANNQVPVLRLLVRSRPNGGFSVAVAEALEIAIEGGHIDAIKLLVNAADEWSIEKVFKRTEGTIRADVLRSILERCRLCRNALASILNVATKAGHCEITELALEKCRPIEREYTLSLWSGAKRRRRPTDSAIAAAMSIATEKGQLDMLQILLAKGGWYASVILHEAVRTNRWEVVRLLLKVCDEQCLEYPGLKFDAVKILEKVAADDDVEMAELFFTKCGAVAENHRALNTAVQNNSAKTIPLLAAKSEPSHVVDAFVIAAGRGQVEMVELLLTQMDQEAIEKALEKVASFGYVATSKLLLTRCNPIACKRIFREAATSGSAGVVQVLVDHMDSCSINRAVISAATRGYTAVVGELVGKADAVAVSCALEVAAIESQLQVIELLRSYCDLDGIRNAVAKARVVGCDEVVALLSSKKARRE